MGFELIFGCLDLNLGCLNLYFGCPDRRTGGRADPLACRRAGRRTGGRTGGPARLQASGSADGQTGRTDGRADSRDARLELECDIGRKWAPCGGYSMESTEERQGQ